VPEDTGCGRPGICLPPRADTDGTAGEYALPQRRVSRCSPPVLTRSIAAGPGVASQPLSIRGRAGPSGNLHALSLPTACAL